MRIATPRRSATASATLSSTGRLRNSVVTWKVRPRPRRTRTDCGARVTSSPPSRIWPLLGASAPISMLTKVVLPAPFGPISACRSPGASRKSMFCATTRAPKDLQSFFVSSEYMVEDAQDPAAREQHDEDQQNADAEEP